MDTVCTLSIKVLFYTHFLWVMQCMMMHVQAEADVIVSYIIQSCSSHLD